MTQLTDTLLRIADDLSSSIAVSPVEVRGLAARVENLQSALRDEINKNAPVEGEPKPKRRPYVPNMPSGIWRHYKGKQYLLLGVAETTDLDGDVRGTVYVVYVPLYVAPGIRMRLRPVEEWDQLVTADGRLPTAEEERESQGSVKWFRDRGFTPRFEFVGNVAHGDEDFLEV